MGITDRLENSRTAKPKTSFFCFKYKNFKMWSLVLIFIVTWQIHDPINCAVVNKEPSPEGMRELLQRSKRDIQEEPFHIRAWSKNCAADTEQDDWILLQHRIFVNDTDEFQEYGWEQYKNGFGDANGTVNGTAYWMGLEKMHQMTLTGTWQLLFIVKGKIKKGHSNWAFSYVIFDNFKIENELLRYELQIGSIWKKSGLFSSESNYKFEYNNGQGFSTKDRDNDGNSRHCAKLCKAGWWFNACTYFSPNMDRRNVLKKLKAKSRVDVTETQMAMKKVK